MENSNTYTKVENYLIHALARVNGTQKRKKARPGVNVGVLQTVLAVCRLTIGFHLTERRLTTEQVSRITGFTRKRQHEHLKRALKLNMISRYDSRGESEIHKKPRYVYSVNLDPLTWQVAMRFPTRHFGVETKKKDVPNKGDKMSPIKGTKDVPNKGDKILAKLLKDPFGYG